MWLLTVQLWLASQTVTVYSKEYRNYEDCWQARTRWIQPEIKEFQVLCLSKGG